MSHIVKCGDCDALLNESPTSPESSPCPYCGSMKRKIMLKLEDRLVPHDRIKVKVRKKGKKKPICEQVHGDDLHRQSGKYYQKERIIDREHNKYKEVLIDPETGEILRHCEEPLTEHRGHGSAKQKKKKKKKKKA